MDDTDYHIINLFQNGSYRAALSAFSALDSPSPLLTLYAARSHLALSPPAIAPAQQLLLSLPPTFDTRALTSLATYLSGEKEEAVGELEELLAELGESGLKEGEEGRFVRGVVGTVWILEGEERREEGVEVLREAVELGEDQECLGLLSHLYISLAQSPSSTSLLTSPTVTAFTSDSLLSQLLSARSNLATGPRSKYEQAYYVYEEIKGMQGGRGEATLAGVSVAQAAQGRWEEAVQAAVEGLEMNPNHPTTLANFVALARYYTPQSGAETEPLTAEGAFAKLQQTEPLHPFLVDLAEKELAFDVAAAKFGLAA
ncbi:coatomer epsilon subunit-domain-containing protein [Leucosporidium creatinivorum]|uniref:Coatomer epsilon subunit-domain-containing protein n=1 Tax=Leucosporidium creatinivorum TaxID=106004 RepID=A0A1Y2ESL2_9BASI|nr:coatomer epsilon subunit-domain-containing protein [Leucosporidium creatinivorum]